MTDTGMCFATSQCPKAELDLYTNQYNAQLEWYRANKNGGGNPTNPTDPTTPVDPNNPTTPVDPNNPTAPPEGGFNYPFTPNGPCVQACNDKFGKAQFPEFSEDPKSPYFLQSLALTFERGTPKTIQFMTDTGMCFATSQCPKAELDLYTNQYNDQLAWYQANKNGGNGTVTPTPTGGETGPTPGAGDSAASKSVATGLVTILAALSALVVAF
ncbi:hypothetical protein BGZ94_009036 [Podila epigama]|nr:hypothetical protein BGZ94_009036 [Podila epigama]